jgi:hypothetical protein
MCLSFQGLFLVSAIRTESKDIDKRNYRIKEAILYIDFTSLFLAHASVNSFISLFWGNLQLIYRTHSKLLPLDVETSFVMSPYFRVHGFPSLE